MTAAHKNTDTIALKFETLIRSGIASHGVAATAKKMGVHHSQISRMQTGRNCFVERAAKLLAVIGFDQSEGTLIIKGEQTAQLAQALISMLGNIKNEAPDCANSAEASKCEPTTK
ncbi:lambda phage CII family protein [Klebsiella variicola subsp. variicola]|uniref:CII family transcriptional regulator n=1 Tax=Klebsiella variicola TaxID=244366 RepID=UPI001E59B8CA|nr:CII family transcriptional regulator [Klebsiella variicola]MCD9775843.1 lambda phage CII family protein [Klebsiella variicola subsp. variicola]